MIRQFAPSDADACCRIIRACLELDLRTPPTVKGLLLQSESPRLMEQRARMFYLAVYETGEGITGIGGLELNEIRLLFVSPEHQGEGVGSALLEHLEAMVPPGLFSDIFVYSAPAAEGFYRARGYVSMGGYVFHVGGLPVPTVFMNKKIRSDS